MSPGEVLAVVAMGLAAGGIAGMFGVGGGVLFVPALTLVLGMDQLGAEATSLLAIIPVAALGTWRQWGTGTVHRSDALWIGAVSSLSAVGGAVLAEIAPERALRVGFAVLLVVVAAQLALRARAAPSG